MFKDYKEIFKGLRDMQDRLWSDSMASFPDSAFPRHMDEWQQQTLQNVNKLVDQAVTQSLNLQRDWLSQWTERVNDKHLKPKTFAELSAEARESTEHWLENQNQLRGQWIKILKDSGTPGDLPDFSGWEKAVQESIEAQMALLDEWSEMAEFKKLSGKEVTKLSSQIAKAMDKSIKTHQRLWSHWLDDLAIPGKPKVEATQTKPRKKQAKTAVKRSRIAKKPAPAADDLKLIAGIGPALEKKLKAGGITTLRQIAELSDADIARLEEEIIRFSGRIEREKWVEQAKKLSS